MKVKIWKPKQHGKFNLSASACTTTNIGFVQPFYFEDIVAKSRLNFNFQSEVQVQPVQVPSFTNFNLKAYVATVKKEDIWRQYPHLISGRHYTSGSNTFDVTTTPKVSLLSLFIHLLRHDLNGTWSIMKTTDTLYVPGKTIHYDTDRELRDGLLNIDELVNLHHSVDDNRSFEQIWANATDMYKLFVNVISCHNIIPNLHSDNKFPSAFDKYQFTNVKSPEILQSEDAFDVIIPTTKGVGPVFGYRFGEFGKKLVAMFRGLGIPIDQYLNVPTVIAQQNIDTILNKNILPFVGYAKVMYDAFAIKRYSDFADSYIGKYIQTISNTQYSASRASTVIPATWNVFNTVDVFGTSGTYASHTFFTGLGNVMLECLYNSFYVTEVDYFSSLNSSAGLQNGSDVNLFSVVRYGGDDIPDIENVEVNNAEIFNYSTTTPTLVNLANRLLHYVNTDNVIGASIYKWFKDKYGITIDTDAVTKSSVIGRFGQRISIDPIYQTAETAEASLGEFAGKARGTSNPQGGVNFTASNDCFVYAFFCIVPPVGYYQGTHSAYDRTERFDHYTPEFDSMGYVPRSQSIMYGSLQEVQGIEPRYFQYKWHPNNLVNGDMSLKSMQNQMQGYQLFRTLNPYDNDNEAGLAVPEPVSDEFRKIGLREVVGNYNRIFVDNSPLEDHFLVNINFGVLAEMPMLPIAESFDTVPEGEASDIATKA